MSCPFYGKNGMFGRLLDNGGIDCALIITSYSPCTMLLEGRVPNAELCPVVQHARQIHDLIDLAGAGTRGWHPIDILPEPGTGGRP